MRLRLQILRILDHLLVRTEFDVRLLPIAPPARAAALAPKLSVKLRCAYRFDLHFENLLHRLLDLGLGGVCIHFEDHGALRLFYAQAFLGNDRPANHTIEFDFHFLSLPLADFGFALGLAATLRGALAL